MESLHLQGTCCAILKSKGTRCTAGAKSAGLCGRHQKCKNVVFYNVPTSSSTIPITTMTTFNNTGMLIHIHHRSRLRYNTVTILDLQKTLTHYGLVIEGKKRDLFDRLLVYFDTLLPYINHIGDIIKIQQQFKCSLDQKINKLKSSFSYKHSDFVNDSDFFTLEKLSTIDPKYIFSYRDSNGFIYGFDMRSINKLLTQSDKNPYTGRKIEADIITNAKSYLHLLDIKGYNLSSCKDEENDTFSNPKYTIKRRIIKVFQEMDNLDQYTNPSWFLDLNTSDLYKFYKEAEDIWNYRLNLSKEIKKQIVPPDGKVFSIEPKNIMKYYPTKDKLRCLCLDVIEKLIYSADDRSDRVNGCIYVLLALVIVNPSAAQAMPAYYTMVTGDIVNANYLEIPI